MKLAIELVRSLVRPVVTVGLSGAFVAACFLDPEAAKLLQAFTGLAIGFWFSDRAHHAKSLRETV